MKNNRRMNNQQTGFTLIELIMVIVILGVLAATALPKFVNLGSDARTAAMKAVEGSMRSTNAMIYAKAAVAVPTQLGATGTVTINGVAITTIFGYASTAGRLALAMDLSPITDFTVSAVATSPGSILHAGAITPANCGVTYGLATATTAPTYTPSPLPNGC